MTPTAQKSTLKAKKGEAKDLSASAVNEAGSGRKTPQLGNCGTSGVKTGFRTELTCE